MENQNDISKRILTIKRTLQAPRQLVWDAWTQAEHIAQWWGPKGMEVKIIENDFKPGGQWKFVMMMPDGNEFISEGVYKEIIVPEKLVTTANFRPMTEGVILQALFEEEGDRTVFTFSVVHPTEEYCRQQEKMGFYNGWGSAFDRLQSYIQSTFFRSAED